MSEEKRSEDELEEPASKDEAAGTAEASDAAAEANDAGAPDATAKEEAEDGEVETEDAGGEEAALDGADPAAIARRVAALGDEDEAERFAQEEERKLAERRAGTKKGGGKRKKKAGLEAAASKRLSTIGTRAEPRRNVALAADVDPLIERTTKLTEWLKKNQRAVQAVGALLCVSLLGVAGYLWYDHKRETEASQTLAKAVEAQRSPIGERKDDDEDDGTVFYKSFADRRAASLEQYRQVQGKFAGTGAAILARLAEGSLLLDGRDPEGALSAFTDVKGSALAAADSEVKGRALEGIGFAHEQRALAAPDEKDKHLDAAIEAFRELENTVEVKGFKELAMYHQARVLMSKGETDKAKELLLSLKERFEKPDESVAPGILPPPLTFPYLREMAMDRLRTIDPSAVPAAPSTQFSPEQLERLMEQLRQQQQDGEP